VRRRAIELGLVFLTALLLLVQRTWPLVRELDSAVPRHPRLESPDSAESWDDLSQLAHTLGVLSAEQRPFEAAGASHGSERSRAWESHGFLPSLFAAPLALAGHPVLGLNLVRFAWVALAACAAWVLGRRLALGVLGSGLLAATWILSAPQAHQTLGRLGELPSPWAPLAALFLLQWMQSPPWAGRSAIGPAVGWGTCVGLSLLSGPASLGPLLALCVLLVLLAPSIEPDQRASRRPGLRLAPPALSALAALLVVTWPWLRAAGAAGPPPEVGLWVSAAPSLRELLQPPELHALFPAPSALESGRPAPAAYHYLGAALLSLAIWGALLDARARRWALAGGGMLVLALDPGGLFAKLVERWPWARVLWAPAAGGMLSSALLPLGVSAAMGARALGQSQAGRAGVVLAGALFMFEVQLRLPQALSRTQVPGSVQRIAELEGEGAVCVLPLALRPHPAQAWEPIHRRRVPLSNASLPDPDLLGLMSVGYPEFSRSIHPDWRPEPEGLAVDLRQAGVDHLLVRERDLAKPSEVLRALDELPGWTRGSSDMGVHWWFRSALLWDDPDLDGS